MHNNYQKLQHVIEQAVNYFQINGKMNYATALRNATGYVLMYESGNHGYRQYRKDVNRNLCESLYFMNSDPYCPIHIKKTVRQVLESYRKMNGLSTDEFKSDRGDKFVNIKQSSSLIESVDTQNVDKEQFARQVVNYMIKDDMVKSDMQDECLEQVLSILDEDPQAMRGGSELDQIAFVRGYGDIIVDALKQVMDSVAYRNRWRDYQEQDEQDIIIEQAFTGRAFPYRAVQPKEQKVVQPVATPVKKELTIADKIRKALKQKLGYNSRQVSVKTHSYSGGSTTYVTLKQQGLDKKGIYEIASSFSRVRYDELTGEYLSGGNQFVEVHDVDGTWLDWRDFEHDDVQQIDYEQTSEIFNRAYDMFNEMEDLEELYDDDVISYVQRELTKQFGRQKSQEQFRRFLKEIRDAYNAVMQNIRRGIR